MSLTRTASLLYDSVLALLYPQRCAVCGGLVSARADGIACEPCWLKVQVFCETDTLCWKCGAFSAGDVAPELREQVRCRRCESQAFAAARACGVYEGALRASVLALKHEPNLCTRLIGMLAKVQSRPPLDSATRIVPVPLHPEREKARGFNQASVIAGQLSRVSNLPCSESCLIRTYHSEQHRAGMDVQGRLDTVANAFEVRHPLLVSGERILLVDDVFTTGATASACASALLTAGAMEVLVLTLARPLH